MVRPLIFTLALFVPAAGAAPPLADTHLHYTWKQAEVTTPARALQILKDNNVVLAVVSSTPPEMALELSRLAPDWIVPFFAPYLEPGSKRSWYNDERVLPAAQRALQAGTFRGLGEIHVIAGLGPNPARRHEVLDGLMELAAGFKVPVMLHVEASSWLFFKPLCERYPQVRIQWAHAGGILPPDQVDRLLAACPNVWAELAARDNDRYVESPIVDEDGRLLPRWRRLIEKYPDRFVVGSDPVWPVDGLSFDDPDTGWEKMNDFLGFHRRWLADLPKELRNKLLLDNARALLKPPDAD